MAILRFFFSLGLLQFFSFSHSFAQQTITVNQDENAAADFTDLQSAINYANDGDTIHVAGTRETFHSISVDKRLNLYGPGYFLTENEASVGSNNRNAEIDSIIFHSDSSGSLISGFSIRSLTAYELKTFYIRGNRLSNLETDSVEELVFSQNIQFRDYGGNIELRGVLCGEISNNILLGNQLRISGPSSLSVSHNLIALNEFTADQMSLILESNIAHGGEINLQDTNTTSRYNVMSSETNNIDDFITDDDRVSSISSIYPEVDTSDWPYSANIPDNTFILPDGSSAKDFPAQGQEAGPFGGNEPYRLSGIPNIPRIKSLSAPTFVTSEEGVWIEISVDVGPSADE